MTPTPDHHGPQQGTGSNSNDRLGTVLRDGDRIALRYERDLDHPPERVWRALTDSASLQHWFPADIVGERAAGAAIVLPFWPEGAAESLTELEAAGVDTSTMDLDEALPGEIRVFDPPSCFEFVWGNAEGAADVLRFDLESRGECTRLVFTTWPGEPGPMGHAGTAAGWHVCLAELIALLDGRGAGGPDRADMMGRELRERYAGLI